ncbi:MAG: glutaredoxin family protein [Sandaracinaceae bacterium]|nr:MAG: glutaredoxin family protein [Sandaracinaceae bacterium]
MPRRPILLLVTCLLVGCGGAVPPASAAERAQVPVTLYTTRWCPVCAHARGWLRARGVPFVERDVESDRAAAARWRQLNRAGTVPVADVDGRVLVGFVRDEWREALDAAAHRRAGRASVR